jgi:hypothetical protein
MKQKKLKDENHRRLEVLKACTQCLKAFRCIECGFEDLCKAKDIGIDDHLVCIEENEPQCNFAFPFGGSLICSCPVRVYVEKYGE